MSTGWRSMKTERLKKRDNYRGIADQNYIGDVFVIS